MRICFSWKTEKGLYVFDFTVLQKKNFSQLAGSVSVQHTVCLCEFFYIKATHQMFLAFAASLAASRIVEDPLKQQLCCFNSDDSLSSK